MQIDFLRADKLRPSDPWLAAWADRYDALLAGGLAGVEAETLAGALCRLVDDILAQGGYDAAYDRLHYRSRQLGHRPVPASYGWVTEQMLFLHRWLDSALSADCRRQAA